MSHFPNSNGQGPVWNGQGALWGSGNLPYFGNTDLGLCSCFVAAWLKMPNGHGNPVNHIQPRATKTRIENNARKYYSSSENSTVSYSDLNGDLIKGMDLTGSFQGKYAFDELKSGGMGFGDLKSALANSTNNNADVRTIMISFYGVRLGSQLMNDLVIFDPNFGCGIYLAPDSLLKDLEALITNDYFNGKWALTACDLCFRKSIALAAPPSATARPALTCPSRPRHGSGNE